MKQAIERQEVLDGIVDSLVGSIKKRAKQPLIGNLLQKEIVSFHKNTEDNSLNGSQVGRVTLMILNALNEVVDRPPIQIPDSESPTQEVLDTTTLTMTSVRKILSMPNPIPRICKRIMSKVINRCEALIEEHNIAPTEIEAIGLSTWERVKDVVE